MDLLFLFFIAIIIGPRHRPAFVVGDDHNSTGATTPAYSTGCLLGSDLPSSDPVDMNFLDKDIIQPTPRLYAWNFLEVDMYPLGA
jgi:hypothetical protein